MGKYTHHANVTMAKKKPTFPSILPQEQISTPIYSVPKHQEIPTRNPHDTNTTTVFHIFNSG
eukprot:2131507-Ditylum_brightwellii.AAC.1